jgi:hypothetical protein
MEPRQESQKPPEPRKEEKQPKRRFQIVKLEERIAPSVPSRHTESPNCCTFPYSRCPN